MNTKRTIEFTCLVAADGIRCDLYFKISSRRQVGFKREIERKWHWQIWPQSGSSNRRQQEGTS